MTHCVALARAGTATACRLRTYVFALMSCLLCTAPSAPRSTDRLRGFARSRACVDAVFRRRVRECRGPRSRAKPRRVRVSAAFGEHGNRRRGRACADPIRDSGVKRWRVFHASRATAAPGIRSAWHPSGSAASAFTNNLGLTGDAGSAPNEFLKLTSAAGIAAIRISGYPSGGSFVLDDLTFSPVQSIDEPETLALLAMAMTILIFGLRRTPA